MSLRKSSGNFHGDDVNAAEWKSYAENGSHNFQMVICFEAYSRQTLYEDNMRITNWHFVCVAFNIRSVHSIQISNVILLQKSPIESDK